MKITTFSFCLHLTILFCMTGCVTGRNPLSGWKGGQTARTGCPFDKTICDDYRHYISELSEDKRAGINDFSVEFFESGRGQRAVVV